MFFENYDETDLLLPGCNFLDYSPRKRLIERTGDILIIDYGNAYGRAIEQSGTSGHWLRTLVGDGNFEFGTGDFTVEMYIVRTRTVSLEAMMTRQGAGSTAIALQFRLASGKPQIVGRPHGSSSVTTVGGSTLVPLDTVCHVAASRKSGVVRLFIDGFKTDEGSFGVNLSSPGTGDERYWYVGSRSGNNDPFAGVFWDVRVTRGIGLYEADFTPPTQFVPLEYTLPPIDPSDVVRSIYGSGATAVTVSGNATKSTGGGVDRVVLIDSELKAVVATAVPDSAGDWITGVPPGTYDIAYFADGCQPVTHGPYEIEAT